MKSHDEELEPERRHFLKCMAWVGTGAVWTIAGGTLKASPLGQAKICAPRGASYLPSTNCGSPSGTIALRRSR